MISCRIARPFAGLRASRFTSSFSQQPSPLQTRSLNQFSDSHFQSRSPPPQAPSSSPSSSHPQTKPPSQRQLHSVPKLDYGPQWAEHGISGLLSPTAFQWAWLDYQGSLVEELNSLTNDEPGLHSYSATDLIAICGRDPSRARLFNYASMAVNNHTFFLGLANETQPVPDPLLEAIEESCSSLESLKAEFMAMAMAMFGPGFVWLVKEQEFGRLRLLSTYLAGSPLPEAHVRSSTPYLSAWDFQGSGREALGSSPRGMSSYDHLQNQQQRRLAPNGIEIVPLLCVNLWEHVWVPDYGVQGKRDYLEAWWSKINWGSIMTNAAQYDSLSGWRISSRGF